jgi:hypothetical protein
MDLIKFPLLGIGFFHIYRGARRRRVKTDHPGPNEPRWHDLLS